MLMLLHGAFGGWDELIIALVAFGVLWVAVKVAGRKSAGDVDDDGQDDDDDHGEERREHATEPSRGAGDAIGGANDVAPPPTTRVG